MNHPTTLKKPSESPPTHFQRKTIWAALTGLAIFTIGLLVVVVVGVVGHVLQFLQTVLVPLAFAGILAYLLEPLIAHLTRRGTQRFRAMIWVFTLFHLTMLILFLSVVVPTIGHVSRWAGKQNHAAMVASLEKTANEILEPLEKLFAPAPKHQIPSAPPAPDKSAPSAASTEIPPPVQPQWWKEWLAEPNHAAALGQRVVAWIGYGLNGFLGAFGYLVGFIMVPFYLYYFLKDADSIRKNWDRFLPLRKSEFKTEVVAVLTEINSYLVAFFRGTMLVSLIDGALVGLALMIFGLPYAAVIGVCTALLGLLPYVGTILCWGAALAISIVHFGVVDNRWSSLPQLWAYPLMITIIFAVVMKLNALVTAPKIIGEAVGLHPLTVIFSVLFWSLLLGPLLGALLAVPLSASVKVLFRRFIWERNLQPRILKSASDSQTADAQT